jgi:ABC-type branched-subunit amino acid transport system substrate-binding protein
MAEGARQLRALAGVHSNYHFTYPSGNRWPENVAFVKKYFDRWKEYPNFQSEGAYVALYMLKTAIERANKLTGGWPEDEAIIGQLEGLGMDNPSGYLYIRPDNHQGYKDAITTLSHPCPCCGGRMIIIETFERGSTPRYRPSAPTPVIRIDTS